MSQKALQKYRHLESSLKLVREANGEETEDDVLDEMDKVWQDLSDEEQNMLRKEGPKCWPS